MASIFYLYKMFDRTDYFIFIERKDGVKMDEDIPVLELGSYSWIDRDGHEYATDEEYYESLEEDDITHK